MCEFNTVIHQICRLQQCTVHHAYTRYTCSCHKIRTHDLTFVVLSVDTFHPGTFFGTKRETTSPERHTGSCLVSKGFLPNCCSTSLSRFCTNWLLMYVWTATQMKHQCSAVGCSIGIPLQIPSIWKQLGICMHIFDSLQCTDYVRTSYYAGAGEACVARVMFGVGEAIWCL